MRSFIIGSRGSHLALWQARHVAFLLECAGIDTRIEIIKTTGDHLQTASLVQAGGKGLFTKEIEDALLAGHIDLAVHSLKDLPTENPFGLAIAAIPERESPFDAIVGRTLNELPNGARIGTSSLRRSAQLKMMRPDLFTEPIRGNVDTRLRKVKEGQFDATLLAAGGPSPSQPGTRNRSNLHAQENSARPPVRAHSQSKLVWAMRPMLSAPNSITLKAVKPSSANAPCSPRLAAVASCPSAPMLNTTTACSA